MRKIIVIALIVSVSIAWGQNMEHAKVNYWKDGYFDQITIDVSKLGQGKIRALVDKKWQEFEPVEFPDGFLDWNFGARIEMLEGISKGQMPTSMAGPHNAAVASYGLLRNDSRYMINNAVKGTGFIPKKEKLGEVINHLELTMESPMPEKLAYLLDLYRNGREIFDLTKQVSLELYATPKFETGTFLNQMSNPGVSLVYIDNPSYELKAVTELIHPDNPELSDYQKDIVKYINLIHSYFHGKFEKMFIAVVYHVTEVYDNSPGKGGKGVRVMPIPSP